MKLAGDYQKELVALLEANASQSAITAKALEAAEATIAQTFPAIYPDAAKKITCRQSCGHCCRQSSIMIEEADALLLAGVTGRSINYAPVDASAWAGKACVFLDANDNCSVYEHRPMTCRMSLSVDDPDLCRTEAERKMIVLKPLYELLTLGIQGKNMQRYIASRGSEADIRAFFPPI